MRINRDSKGWERLSKMRQCESQVTVAPFVWHPLSPLCGLYAVPLSRTVATDNRRLTASWSGGFPACTVTLYSHLVPPMWRWNSLCVLMGAHHAGDKGKETLWDFVRFLTPSCLTPFSDCAVAGLLAGRRIGGVRSDSSLSVLHMNRRDHNITIVWVIALCLHPQRWTRPWPDATAGSDLREPAMFQKEERHDAHGTHGMSPINSALLPAAGRKPEQIPPDFKQVLCKWCKSLLLMRNDDAMILLLRQLRIETWSCININHLKVINALSKIFFLFQVAVPWFHYKENCCVVWLIWTCYIKARGSTETCYFDRVQTW